MDLIRLVKKVLQLLYMATVEIIVNGRDLGIDTRHEN